MLDNFLELSYLFLDDLPSHCISDSVSVDDEVIRVQLLRVLSFIGLNGGSQSIFKLGVDNLLSLFLQNLVRVVLAHLWVDGSTEANNGLLALMAYIDSNEHSVWRNFLGEFQVVEVSTELGVHLSQNVGGNRQVSFLDDSRANNLGDDVHAVADVLVGLVGFLIVQDDDDDLGLSALVDVASQFLGKSVVVIFSWEFDPLRLLNVHLKDLGALLQLALQVFSQSVVLVRVCNHPGAFLQHLSFLDGQSSEDVGVTYFTLSIG